jgi:hypothetical protein
MDLHLRLGRFALTVERYPVGIGWGLHRWRYGSQESWRHGAAYLGRVKLIW